MVTVLKSERVIMCDIDDTLVIHEIPDGTPTNERVAVVDALDGKTQIFLRINKPMVRLVREEMARGSQIVFWSRGGYQWAFNVVSALGFTDGPEHVVIMTKPYAYFDDSDVTTWLKDRVYISPDAKYKK